MSAPQGVFQIHYVDGVDGKGKWIAKVENTNMEYDFNMGPDGDSEEFVEAFARAMGEGRESVLESLTTCIDYYMSGIQIWKEQFFNSYFVNCGELQYFNLDTPFTGTEGSSLADELEEAGEWLIEAIAV